ncbi:MAG: UDP-4-amino-4,6-dideoxy-N-acetyl-beta-L-altrosamine transaminase [Candidatus Berkiella sp.]
MRTLIPYARQNIDDEDIQTVVEILQSDWLTQGPVVPEFEQACSQYVKANYGVAVSSATAALHLSCLALGVGPGDRIWTSPNTFVASSNCALYCGAQVDFVDIDKDTYNFSVDAFEEKLKIAEKANKLPKVVVPVHFAGQSCDMKAIKALADQYEIKIIEDASHAIGGRYLDNAIGSCQYSDITVFSFHPVKIITTAEGGLALTNSEKLQNKLGLLRSHGITRDQLHLTKTSEGPWYYQQIELGFNYRLTDLQAGIGLSQLKKIDTFIAKRNQIAKRYDEELKDLPVITPWQSKNCYNAYHLYTIELKQHDRKEIFEQLRQKQIGVNVHYIPVHTQPYYQSLGFKIGDFPNAERYYARTISLPMYYSLSQEQQSFVIDTLTQILAS